MELNLVEAPHSKDFDTLKSFDKFLEIKILYCFYRYTSTRFKILFHHTFGIFYGASFITSTICCTFFSLISTLQFSE